MDELGLAADLERALDPVALAAGCGLTPDPWQAGVLRSRSPRILLNCSRQVGKSTTTSIKALHVALYRPRSLTLCLAPAERQSKELFRKIADSYRALGRPVPAEAENKLELELTNGSRIVALPGKEGTVRGFSGATLLLIDEAARVEDALYKSVRPMLAASGGELVALSTPFGKRGWWHREWTEGGPSWERVQVPATECPRISAEFLIEERASLGEWWYLQEYGCQFMDATDSVFRHEFVQAARSEEVEPW